MNNEVNPFLVGIGGGSPVFTAGFGPTPPGVFMQDIVGKAKSDRSSLDPLQESAPGGR